MKKWYVDASRVAIDWDTAVVDGVATIDIHTIVQLPGDSRPELELFARAGTRVSDQQVADAQAAQSEDAIPAAWSPPPAPSDPSGGTTIPVQDTPPDSPAQGDLWIDTSEDPAGASVPDGMLIEDGNPRYVLASDEHSITISDPAASPDGSGNGIAWESGASDGADDQGMIVYTGPDGAHSLQFMGDGILQIDGQPAVGGASEQSNGYYDSGNGGDGFTVPHTGPALAPWAASSGTELLDLTDPTQPTVVSDGLYAVTANVSADSTPTKDSALTLTLNTAGGLGTQIADVIGPVGGLGGGSATAFLAAGSAITVSVRNKESTDQTYYLSATVCKIA